ncbi:MAG: hypothetical protein ABEI86_09790 [Halobacteriaceae archaeon]
MTFINSVEDVLISIGFLIAVIIIYFAIERIQPGYGSFPREFSNALKWLDENASKERVLAWWDYAAPLDDYTNVDPYLEGPSPAIKDLVDNPDKVREWTDDEKTAKVGHFFLADNEQEALRRVEPSDFDLILVARSDLMKVPAMREAAQATQPPDITDPESVMIRQLLEKTVDWPLEYENDQVRIYRIPETHS